MEELGIGRPSTYASTLAVLQERDYVRIDKKRLIPEDKGRLVTAFLESFFKRYVEYDFTADLEEKLDLISDGKLEWKDVLRDFWRDFTAAVGEIKDLRVGEVLEALNEILGPHIFPPKAEGGDPRQCPNCGEGRLSLKVGKFGAFIGCSNYPDCRYTRQFSDTQNGAPEASTPDGKLLGHDPETGLPVTLRTGRFGPYVQLGEGRGRGEAQARLRAQGHRCRHAVDLERRAAAAVAAARDRPASGDRQADHGRPRPLRAVHPARRHLRQPADGGGGVRVGINRAVVLLAEKKAGGGKGRFQRAAPTVLKELGEHPSEGGKVQVLSGRYGPYVKHGDVNATLPRAKDPAALTMDEAVQLIAERVAKGPSKPKGRRAKTGKAGSKAGQDAAATRRTRRQGKAAKGDKPQAQGARASRKQRHPRGGGIGRTGKTVPRKPKEPRRARACQARTTSSNFVRSAPAKAGKREIARAFSDQGRRPRRAQEAAGGDGR